MGDEPASGETSLDALLGGRLTLRQLRKGHRIGTDTVLLAALAKALGGENVVDLGAGAGGVGLMLASVDPDCRVTLVEREPLLAALARENVTQGGFEERVSIVEADVTGLGKGGSIRPPAGNADLIVCNPPFHPVGSHRGSPEELRRDAHVAGAGDLDLWIRAAARLAAPGASFALIHRADELATVLAALKGRFGGIALRPVHPRADAPAMRVLVSARKGARAPLSLLTPLVLHGPDGSFTAEAAALHAGDFAALAWPVPKRKGAPKRPSRVDKS